MKTADSLKRLNSTCVQWQKTESKLHATVKCNCTVHATVVSCRHTFIMCIMIRQGSEQITLHFNNMKQQGKTDSTLYESVYNHSYTANLHNNGIAHNLERPQAASQHHNCKIWHVPLHGTAQDSFSSAQPALLTAGSKAPRLSTTLDAVEPNDFPVCLHHYVKAQAR